MSVKGTEAAVLLRGRGALLEIGQHPLRIPQQQIMQQIVSSASADELEACAADLPPPATTTKRLPLQPALSDTQQRHVHSAAPTR